MTLKFTQNEYPELIKNIINQRDNIGALGRRWSRDSVHNLDRHLRHNLATQGRSRPPKLSDATLKIYSIRGEPSGSGIRNHIKIEYQTEQNYSIAILGIPEGKPTTVARTQEYGATIKITPKMRGYLAQFAIYLRADTKVIHIPARFFWSLGNTRGQEESKELLSRLYRELITFK